ncbi:MAG: DUF4412 domain-containing protein [Gemmatimonadota bacterium]|nr:MAG: DUF4412 domain-containing protein [Gemmatimonadota bacterium]
MRLPRTYPLAALLSLLALPALSWAQGFEGTIETRTISVDEEALYYFLDPEGEAEEEPDVTKIFDIPVAQMIATTPEWGEVEVEQLTYHIKGTMMRVDGGVDEEMPGYALLDFASGTFQLVNPAERMVLEMTKEDFEQMKEIVPGYGEEEEEAREKARVRPLGQSKEINGMSCTAFEIASGEDLTIAWVTRDLQDVVDVFLELESRMKGMGMFEEDDEDTEVFLLVAEHGFPVVEQTLTQSEWGGSTYEVSAVTSVERRSLSDDLFTAPADYERRSILEMFRMFGGGN